jgi:hypothetical protein
MPVQSRFWEKPIAATPPEFIEKSTSLKVDVVNPKEAVS